MNELSEYKRIKRSFHTRPLSDNEFILQEIEDFGKQCSDRKLYATLMRKFKWHRLWFPKNLALGKAPEQWTSSVSPLVTVIVPNYSHSPYLNERIDCILNQTFQNFELIILDDCSPDNSRDIILQYKDHPRVSHIVLNEQNTGNTFLQWEKGVALAKGKYIWIAESDDYADETFLDCCLAMFYLHQDCVLVRTGSYQVNERDRVLVRDWDVWKEDETVHYYKGDDYIRHNMLHFNYLYNASMVVFRKDVFQQIDKSYQRLRYTGDWQCWIEFLTHGPICEYRRKLNYFRQHQNKVSVRSNSTNKGIIDQVKVLAYTIHKIPMSYFRRFMIRGEQYGVCQRWLSEVSDQEVIDAANAAITNYLKARPWHHALYKIVSLFDFLPCVPSEKNDKYK